MKKGFLIIKPDMLENMEMVNLLLNTLDDMFNDFKIYKIKNYGDFCQRYRKHDIWNTNSSPSEKAIELQRTSYATYAYKKYYADTPAYAVVVKEDEEDSLYEKLSQIKINFRALSKSSKQFHLYVDISNEDDWKIYKHYLNNEADKEYIDSPNVKLAYMNGIHLEEYDLFKRNIGMDFLNKNGIISSENLIQRETLTGEKE